MNTPPYRLVEYITTIGVYDTLKEYINQIDEDILNLQNLSIDSRILNRFPIDDHPDFPFPAGIVKFCIPNGWKIDIQPKRPLFYSVVLTDMEGINSYAACIVWNEYIGPYNRHKNNTIDIYAPKCMCIISRLPYFNEFKECLMAIFDTLWKQDKFEYNNQQFIPETIINTLINIPKVIDSGVEPFKLPLYNSYYINIQPPLTTQFNSTDDNVYFLATHIGVCNLIRLFNVLLLDNKILFVSSSYNFLYKACQGLVSLLYPLKFNHIFIPLLPKQLTDIVNAPTPFIIGMHNSCYRDFSSSGLGSDVVVANLDTGYININNEHNAPYLPNEYINFLETNISRILFPQLEHSDELFSRISNLNNIEKDKKIRANFLIFMLKLLGGYLTCTNVVRIHPTVLIKFQKDQFVYMKQLQHCQFTNKFLDTMIFNYFVVERGIPYRHCDIFDDLVMRLQNSKYSDKFISNFLTNTIATIFMENERTTSINVDNNPYTHNMGYLDEIMFEKITIRDIRTDKITCPDNQQLLPHQLHHSYCSLAKMARIKSLIPLDINSYTIGLSYKLKIVDANIIREFVKCIFNNQCPRALQMINKIKYMGNQSGVRILLCNELNSRLEQNLSQLNCVQFSLLCDVINTYLDNENDGFCYVMSSLVVDISNQFYMRAGNNIISMYTQLHDHKIWSDLSFWESLFYVTAQSQLISFYLTNKSLFSIQAPFNKDNYANYYMNENLYNSNDDPTIETIIHPSYYEVNGVMPVVADQLIKREHLTNDQLGKFENMESDLLFSTTSLYISKILCMNLQMKEAHHYIHDLNETNTSLIEKIPTNEITKNSHHMEHLQEKSVDYQSIRDLIRRFISNVFMALDFKFNTSSGMISRISEIMKFHCEALNRIYTAKEKIEINISDTIKSPLNLPNEIVLSTFNCSMYPEGLNNCFNVKFNSASILPAKGIIFITYYRLIFYGYPINPYTSNNIITKSIPFGLIRCVKTTEGNFIPTAYQKHMAINQCAIIYLKSGGCVIVGFNQESSQEKIDTFNKIIFKRYSSLLSKLNHNEDIILEAPDSTNPIGEQHEKPNAELTTPTTESRHSVHSDLDFDMQRCQIESTEAKAALKASRVGTIKLNVKKKFQLLNNLYNKKNKPLHSDTTLVTSSSVTKSKSKQSCNDFNFVYKEIFDNGLHTIEAITKKFSSGSLYISDYERMGLLIHNKHTSSSIFVRGDWRLTLLNVQKLIPTLPKIFPVPFQPSDDILFRVAKSFKAKRLPVLSWLNVNSSAESDSDNLLPGAILRCGSLVSKCLNILASKSQSCSTSTKQSNYNNNYNELDNYFVNLVGISSKIRVVHSIQHEKPSVDSTNQETRELYTEILDKLRRPHKLFLTSSMESYDVSDVSCQFSDLYVFGDKSFPKGASDDKKISILNIETPDSSQIESAFRKLNKSIWSYKQTDLTVGSHLNLLAHSKWFNYVKKLLKLSSNVAFVIDYGESFSMISFGDGSETSAQISSLAQIMVDPIYRTIDGFQALIEKEWLAFKYRFLLRNGVTSQATSSFYPIFLMFLDCVHQLLLQFPNAFEFNDYFLKFIAYHHLSNRFDTFITCSTQSFSTDSSNKDGDPLSDHLFLKNIDEYYAPKNTDHDDNKATESKSNIIKQDSEIFNPKVIIIDDNTPTSDNTQFEAAQTFDSNDCIRKETIWSYINKYREKMPIFINSHYIQGINLILYANTHIANIDLWDFYYQIPQLMITDFYELENLKMEFFVDPTYVFVYNQDVPDKTTFANVNTNSFDILENDVEKPYVFFDGSSYLGYILEDTPLIVDKFNYTLNHYLQNNNDNQKLSSILNYTKLTVKNKIATCINTVDITQTNSYELKYSNYCSILDIKKYFISLISTDKSFYSKTISLNSDHYFSQVTHDFAEAPPSNNHNCISCSKTLAGKCNYYTCLKCNLNVHIKCSKNISQICNMGEFVLKSPEPTTLTRQRKSTLTKKLTRVLHKNQKIGQNSDTGKGGSSKDGGSAKFSTDYDMTADNNHPPSCTLSISYSVNSIPVSVTALIQGYLYKYKSNSKKNKKYYILDDINGKLLIYDKNPSSKYSVLLEEYNLIDLTSCTCNNYSSMNNVNNNLHDSATIDHSDKESKPKTRNSQNASLFFELKFNSRNKPIVVGAKNDDETNKWFQAIKKYIDS